MTTAQAPKASQRAATREDAGWLAPLVLLFLIKQLLLVAIIGPFTGHDEVDHFYYIQRLAAGDGLGVVGEVMLPEETKPYQKYVADYPNNAEVIQPPLYHALLAPISRLIPRGVETNLYALRLISVVIGLAAVWLAYLTARLVFPDSPLLCAGVPIFVAFQPQFSFEAAIVNHDILVIALFSLVVYLTLRGLHDGFSPRLELLLGFVVAAGLWTKTSFGLVLPVMVLGVWLAWRDRRREWGDWLDAWHWLVGSLVVTVLLPLLLVAPWFVRSFVLYGDPTGARRLQEIPEYGDQAQAYWAMLASKEFWRGRLEDFWGNYGWRQVPFDPGVYRLIWTLWAAAGIALLAFLIRALVRRRRHLPPMLSRFQWRALGLLALSVVLLVYGVLYVGTIQFTQSRFAFPGMIGFAVLTLVGVDRWLPGRLRPLALPLLLVLLVGLNVLVSLRFLIPFYYGPGGGGAISP